MVLFVYSDLKNNKNLIFKIRLNLGLLKQKKQIKYKNIFLYLH